MNIATYSKNGKVPICSVLLEVIPIWESLSQRGWQLEIKGISVNRRVFYVSRKVCPSWSRNRNGLLCFLKLCYAFKTVKLGVSRKTLSRLRFQLMPFNISLSFPSSFLQRKNDKQGDKGHIRDSMAKREGAWWIWGFAEQLNRVAAAPTLNVESTSWQNDWWFCRSRDHGLET